MIPKSMEEFQKQLSELQEKTDSISEFFSILKNNKLSWKDLSSIIDVKKYDDATKNFEPIQFYVAFEKRREALYVLESIEEIKKETHQDYLDEGNDYLSESDYLIDKNHRISEAEFELYDIICRIIAGDNVHITQSDLRYVRGWEFQTPITTIDMKSIAFDNQHNGLIGGMDNEKYNRIIFDMICGNINAEVLKELREIPDGYGWPKIGLNQRVWARIDINTPDDILIEAFTNWLKEVRTLPCFNYEEIPYHLFSEGEVKQSHYKKWHSLKVIPYLDLKIFSTVTNSKITLKNYGDILYYDDFEVDTTEKVRKTLIPMVNEIFGSSYLNNLLKKIIAQGA